MGNEITKEQINMMMALALMKYLYREGKISALGNQVQYYDNLLAQHPDWELYDRYIDEVATMMRSAIKVATGHGTSE